MRFMRFFSFICFLLSVFFTCACVPEAEVEAQDVSALVRLVERVTPEYAGKVHFRLDPELAAPTIQTQGEGILICSAGVSEGARAYGWYLRELAQVHFSRNGDNKSAAVFVQPKEAVHVPPTLPLNFAYNYCTLSYTGAHWSEARWMRELDLLALDGFRYVLVTPGLEKVWQGFLRELNYPEEKIAGFIAAPAYSAWWNMGNLEGEGGPVSSELIDREAELGRSITRRLRELGMVPVLQAYTGLLPHDFSGYRSSVIKQGKWCGTYTRPAMLAPDSEAFEHVAHLWYKHLHAVYDFKPQAFIGDLFHEGGNRKGVTLDKAAAAVQKAMQHFSPRSLWFIQAWGYNPLPAILRGTSVQDTVVLALHKNLSPSADITRRYGGRRYVWCELANFGGKQGLYGGFDILEKMEGNAGGASGLGLLSEGLETNPVYYELFAERVSNRSIIDRAAFLARYARARYGSTDPRLTQALALLARSVYTPDGQREGGLENIMCARPGPDVDRVTTWSNPKPYCDPRDVQQAGQLMLAAAHDLPELMQRSTFRYDLVDICREVIANKARACLLRYREALAAGDKEGSAREAESFCALFPEMADLLATHEDFLLGAYLKGVAERAGASDAAAMQRSVRQLISTWSSDTGMLDDYSYRQFSEPMRHYYLPRWQAYFRSADAGGEMQSHIETNTNNGAQVTSTWYENAEIDALEKQFPTADFPLLIEPKGDLLSAAAEALK